MHPIYRFVLSIDGENAMQAFPLYKDDLAIDYEQESGQQFFRGKFNGKITFAGNDFVRIMAAAFDAEFGLEVLISYDAGLTWASYWTGQFWKTDCDINEDDKTAIVTPTLKDRYNEVLAGLEKEYNLIDLKPEISTIKYDKRPLLQVYVKGTSTVGCFLSNMWWEQECDAINDGDALRDTYHFILNKRFILVDISHAGTPELPNFFAGEGLLSSTTLDITKDGFRFVFTIGNPSVCSIIRVSDEVTLWRNTNITFTGFPASFTLQPVSDSGATETVDVYVHSPYDIFARFLTDNENVTYEVPTNDIVSNNRNYKRVIPHYMTNSFFCSDRLVSIPTEYGVYQPGKYYTKPDELNRGYIPIARSVWSKISFWFLPISLYDIEEMSLRKNAILKDAYPLWSVISVLLGKIAPGITHDGTAIYSEFLYGTTNPLVSYLTQALFITQKSNIISSGYDQPAQKAPITLKYVLDMLKNCFRCYWFIDEQNRFRIEHVAWFMRGGTYDGQEPEVGINLTTEIVTRNGKPWAYARNQYKFDKPEMASRYQFGWMDDVTTPFEGRPIDIVSKYVNPDSIEEISVQQFTSDIDYILLNPSEISKDGFVLLGTIQKSYVDNLPISTSIGTYDLSVSSWQAGEYVRVKVRAAAALLPGFSISFLDDNNNSLGVLHSQRIPPTGIQDIDTGFVLIPNGATKLRFAANRTVSLTITDVVSGYELPYLSIQADGISYNLQNGRTAFEALQEFYRYDMPAKRFSIGDSVFTARGIKKLKTQEINFPVLQEPDFFNLIKTELGDGSIQKMSVNLSSRNAKTTLKYDTE